MITSFNPFINKGFKESALFFPQMKPEKKQVAVSEDAKAILHLLNQNGKTELNDLKSQSGLSGKKWDKAIKELTASKLAQVEKTDEGLFVGIGD